MDGGENKGQTSALRESEEHIWWWLSGRNWGRKVSQLNWRFLGKSDDDNLSMSCFLVYTVTSTISLSSHSLMRWTVRLYGRNRRR